MELFSDRLIRTWVPDIIKNEIYRNTLYVNIHSCADTFDNLKFLYIHNFKTFILTILNLKRSAVSVSQLRENFFMEKFSLQHFFLLAVKIKFQKFLKPSFFRTYYQSPKFFHKNLYMLKVLLKAKNIFA